MINYGKHYIDKKDINLVSKILKSELITQGDYVAKFEKALNKKFGSMHCCAVSSGTAALHLVGLALGWKAEDIVLGSTLSFLASSNCIIYSGAKPDFVDIDNKSYTLDVGQIEDKIKKYKRLNKKIVAIVATDYAGHPCDWTSLKFLANKYNLKLINDNCHALGSRYKNDSKYAIKYADFVTHSYHPVKHITTGEGGSVLTNSKKIDEKIRMLRSHGILKKFKKNNLKKKLWYYEMHNLGYNYRITDFQCALGISQLSKLDMFIKRRREIAKIYNTNLNDGNIFTIPEEKKNFKHAYHLYPCQINFEKLKISKTEFFNIMKKNKINLQVHYIPIHLQPFYRKNYGFKIGDFPKAEKFYAKEVSLPIYFSLKKEEVYKVVNNIKSLCIKK